MNTFEQSMPLPIRLAARMVMPSPQGDIKTHDPYIMVIMEHAGPKFYRFLPQKQHLTKQLTPDASDVIITAN